MAQSDHPAFLQLYSRHYLDLFRFVLALTPNRKDAEDIMQEVSVALWEKFEQFDPAQGNFLAWARGFARLGVLKHRRSHARRRCVLAPDVIELLADEPSPEVELQELRRAALQHCLSRLGRQARQLITDRYMIRHGELEELAEQAGRSVNALSIALYRIRQQLMKCISTELRQQEGL